VSNDDRIDLLGELFPQVLFIIQFNLKQPTTPVMQEYDTI